MNNVEQFVVPQTATLAGFDKNRAAASHTAPTAANDRRGPSGSDWNTGRKEKKAARKPLAGGRPPGLSTAFGKASRNPRVGVIFVKPIYGHGAKKAMVSRSSIFRRDVRFAHFPRRLSL